MKKIIVSSFILILICVVVTGLVMAYLEKTKPIAEKRNAEVVTPVVEVVTVQRKDAQFALESEGVVSTLRETDLAVEVTGRVVFVVERFEAGGSFQAGEIILTVDDTNYRAAKAQAQAALADARLNQEQEIARGAQAVRDWEKIGGGEVASDLVLRKPFLESAKARVVSAQAALDKAMEDILRTSLRAPFDCRVRRANLDLGAIAVPGSPIGQVYDNSKYIVRLPFSLDDYASLPKDVEIKLFSEVGGQQYDWAATVLWEDGDLDRTTLSAYVIAEFYPNVNNGKRFLLPPAGMFVKAEVSGAALKQVVAVPRSAVRGRNEIAVVNEDNQLEFRTLEIVRSTAGMVYVKSGVEDGERVIMTKLELPVEGMSLKVVEDEPES